MNTISVENLTVPAINLQDVQKFCKAARCSNLSNTGECIVYTEMTFALTTKAQKCVCAEVCVENGSSKPRMGILRQETPDLIFRPYPIASRISIHIGSVK